MKTETATLIAASIAAVSSIIVLLISMSEQRQSELRAAHRMIMDGFLTDLASSIHQAVACANVLLKTNSADAAANWRAKGQNASAKLKELRTQIRYPLWGLDEGLRVLSRVPDWADHLRSNKQLGERLDSSADLLRKSLDYAIRRSYRKGRPPTLHERLFVRYRAYNCRSIYGETKELMQKEKDE